MLIAVVVMRFVIKRIPNLLPNENLVIVHVLLFTAVTSTWILLRVYAANLHEAENEFYAHPTIESYLNWIYASASYVKVQLAYNTVDALLHLFMLYMLHQFSIFEGFVYDPITG